MASEKGDPCRVCGAVNPPGTKTCSACGIALIAASPKSGDDVDGLLKGLLETEQARSDAGADENIDDLLDSLVIAAEESVDCPICGKSVPPGAEQCPDCGSEFVEKPIEPEGPTGEDLFALDLETELDKLSDAVDVADAAQAEVRPGIDQEAEMGALAEPEPVASEEPAVESEAPLEAVKPTAAPAQRRTPAAEIREAGEEEASAEFDTSDGDLPKVHIFGSRYVDYVVVATISAMVAAFAVFGMYQWSNLSAMNVALLIGIAFGGIVASFLMFRASVSAVAEGDRQLRDGKYREALECYERAIHIDSRPSAAWTSKGVALKRMERYGEALKAHNMALKLNPRNEIALCNRGDLMFRVGKLDEALENYDQALGIRPSYAVAWNNKAIALARLGRLDDAKECEDEAVRLKPKYAAAWVNRGRILVQLGFRDEAVRCLQRARALSVAKA